MVKNNTFISIREILSRLMRHPLLTDTSLEQVIDYTVEFINIFGLNDTYMQKEEKVNIKDYRASLPCDLISIISITDDCCHQLLPTSNKCSSNCNTYSIKGNILHTSIKEGVLNISYYSIPVDDEGLPMIPDNAVFLKALEAYIKKELFTILFDLGKINPNALQNAQAQYAWLAGQVRSEFTLPSVGEMENIKNMWTSVLQINNHYSNNFKSLHSNYNIKIQ